MNISTQTQAVSYGAFEDLAVPTTALPPREQQRVAIPFSRHEPPHNPREKIAQDIRNLERDIASWQPQFDNHRPLHSAGNIPFYLHDFDPNSFLPSTIRRSA
ncbi:MAG TPA: hypothetical protein VGL08_17175 [Paraburkholderia sp.]|jgi:hypothetical protein